VISGFNTDVEFDSVVYHVQTEDKGEKSHLIVSLVYNGGTILASKRASYEDMAIAGVDTNALAERVQRQHQLICAAVRAGRMNELKGMAARDRRTAAKSKAVTAAPTVPVPDPVPTVAANAAPVAKAHEVSVPAAPVIEQSPPGSAPVGVIDAVETIPVYEIFDDSPLIEGVSIVEEDAVLPAEAVAVVSEFSGIERPTNTKLSIELLGESKFKGGERRTVNVMVCRGTERRVISNAEIMIKVLGSSFRPLIFHAKSDVNGLARVHLQLPHFEAGRAALLIRAINNGDETELRRIVTPG
jgi:hypothetical protein